MIFVASWFVLSCGAWCLYCAFRLQQRRRALDQLLADLHRREAYLTDLWNALDKRTELLNVRRKLLDDLTTLRYSWTKGQKETRH